MIPTEPGRRRGRGRSCESGRLDGRGFTLIELVAVLAILAATAALVIPAVGRGSGVLRLRTGAGRVAALLREARVQAVSRGRPTRVILDRARNTVTLAAAHPDRSARQVELPTGLHLSAASGGETLTFSPRGLTREARWVVEATGGQRLVIRVDGVSGRVTVVPEGS